MRAHVLERARPDGPRPRLRLRRLLRPAVRVAAASPPGAVRAGPRRGRRGPIRAGRRHVGRVATPTCRAARRWPASSCTASGSSSSELGVEPARSGCPTRSATPPRCRRSRGGAARGTSSPRRSPGTRPTGCRTTPSSGRASTAPGSSPTSRRPTPTTPTFGRPTSPAAERQLRREGRAATCRSGCSAGATAAAGPTREMLAAAHRKADLDGSPRVDARHPDAFFAEAEAELPEPAGLVGGAVPRAAPRHLHLAAPHEAGQPAQRAPAARGRAVGDHRGRAARAPLPVRRARDGLADRAAAAVPRHPAGLVDRLGAPGGGARTTRRSPATLEAA